MPVSGVFVAGSFVYPAGSQTVQNSDPQLAYGNSATSFTTALQTASGTTQTQAIPDDERAFFNAGTGTMFVAAVFAGGLVSPYALTQGNGITVKWSKDLLAWVVIRAHKRGSRTYKYNLTATTGQVINLPVSDDGSPANVIIKPPTGGLTLLQSVQLVWPQAPDRMVMRITTTGSIAAFTNSYSTNVTNGSINTVVDSVVSALTSGLLGTKGQWFYDLADATWYPISN